jgi:hypothetical protein
VLQAQHAAVWHRPWCWVVAPAMHCHQGAGVHAVMAAARRCNILSGTLRDAQQVLLPAGPPTLSA